jgi:hypothetical protein
MASMLTAMHGLLLVAILLAGAAILAHSQPILVYDDNVDEKFLLNALQQPNRQFFFVAHCLSSSIVALYFQKKTNELPVKC